MHALRHLILATALCAAAFSLKAQPADITLTLFDGGYNEPLFLTHAGDARIFVVEKDGVIKIVDQNGNVNPTPFLDINSRVGSGGSEQGLLGLAFHPRYKENGMFFVNYTNNSGNTIVSRFFVSANPNQANSSSEQVLLTINQPYTNHNGGCIAFGADGHLYIGMGDGGSGGDPLDAGQGDATRLGKMLRINVDGTTGYTIPASNPYINDANAIMREVWAYGVRNPWRFSFDRQNGDLWIGDVGQNAWEEIDHLPYGSDPAPNFGWRCYEGNAPYNTSGCQAATAYDPPIFVYNHSSHCSVTGGYIYRGGRYASLNGYYFFTDYCSGRFWTTKHNGGNSYTTTLGDQYSQYDLVSFGEDVFGELYVIGISSGNIWRISDTTSAPQATILAPDSLTICEDSLELRAAGTPALSFQWQLNGADIVGADTSVLSITQSGDYRVIVGHQGFSDTSSVVHVNFTQAPTVSISGLLPSYCTFDLPAPITGTPAGGHWVGPGITSSITGGNFNPAAAGPGSHEIIYAIDAGYGCAAADTFTTNVAVCPGIGNATILPGFVAYPSPAQEALYVRFDMEHAAAVTWTLTDVQGRTVMSGLQDIQFGGFRQRIDVKGIAPGLYVLGLQIEGQAYTHKISVQR